MINLFFRLIILFVVDVVEPQQQVLKRLNDDDSEELNHKKVKHVKVVEPEPEVKSDVAVNENKEQQPAIENKTNNIEMEVVVNKTNSRSNSTESQSRSPLRSLSTRSLSPANDTEASKSKSSSSNVSIKSESVIKEVPMSGDRNRFSRSRSPKSRWHASPTPDPETNNEKLEEIPEASVLNEKNDEQKVEVEANKVPAAVEETDIPKVQRKRRWFTSANDPLKNISTNNSVPISSESLKVIFLLNQIVADLTEALFF